MKAVIFHNGKFKEQIIDKSVIDNDVIGKGKIHIELFSIDLNYENTPIVRLKSPTLYTRANNYYFIIFSSKFDFNILTEMLNLHIERYRETVKELYNTLGFM